MKTQKITVDTKTYLRLQDNSQLYWIFKQDEVQIGDVLIFNVETGGQSDLYRKITHLDEISEGVVAALVPHQMARIARAFAPKGGYTGSFH